VLLYTVHTPTLLSAWPGFKNFYPKGSKPSGSGSSAKRAADKAAGERGEAVLVALGVYGEWDGI